MYGPCTFHVHGRRRPCRRPVHSHVHGWCRLAVCTAHTWPCTGRVYGTAVYGPCIRHGRYTAVLRAVFAGKDVFTGRVHGRRVTGTRHVTRRCTRPVRSRTAVDGTRTRPCNCRVDFPCTPYTWRCNGCVHVSRAQGPCTWPWTGRVDGPCIRLPTWPLRLHGPYMAIIRRQDNTHFIPFTCILFFICKRERCITYLLPCNYGNNK